MKQEFRIVYNKLVLTFETNSGTFRLFKTSDLFGRMDLTYENFKRTNIYSFHSNCYKQFTIPNTYKRVVIDLTNSEYFNKPQLELTFFNETIFQLNSCGELYLL